MKENRSLYLLVLASILSLSACSETPKEDKQGWILSTTEKNDLTNVTGNNGQQEEEGPQYQRPTMDVLRGKPQNFRPNIRYNAIPIHK